jgi:hypothetical protein
MFMTLSQDYAGNKQTSYETTEMHIFTAQVHRMYRRLKFGGGQAYTRSYV